MNKTRFDSVLFQLSEDDQAKVYDWIRQLGYGETLRRLAQPAPQGLGITTYHTSLHRFYARYTRKITEENVFETTDLALPDGSRQKLHTATDDAMSNLAFELSHSPTDPETFNHLSRWLYKQKSQEIKLQYLQLAQQQVELARERLKLDRDKAETSIARLALKHAAGLQQIKTNPSFDDEARIQAARRLIFGEAADLIQ